MPAVACRALNINRKTYYEHLAKDQAFAKAIEDATPEGVETVEGIAFQLATIGRRRKKFFQANRSWTRRRASSTRSSRSIRH